MTEAIAIFLSGGSEASEERQRYLGEPLTSGCFKDAHDLWLTEHQTNSGDPVSRIIDPGFELEINLHEPGFGWRTTGKAPTLALALEAASSCAGRHSLRVEFNGESDPAPPIISQLVLVEPHTRYHCILPFARKGSLAVGFRQ